MQAIFLYNTLSRQKEEFKPLTPGRVGMYTCGPTVYNPQHIGNLRTAILGDLLKRMFQLNGLEVKHVMNITDVDDKILAEAKKTGMSPWDITEKYTKVYLSDLASLNIIPPSVWSKATEHIPDMVKLVQELEARGFTYKTSDGIYFDTSKFPSYGKLGGQKAEDKKAGARVELGEKKHHTDFALWKFTPKGEKRAMEWESPWGKGFPGWHIECSAMASKYLGEPFDLHAGGADLVTVHHENEIAQSEAAHDTQFARYWVHGGMLEIDRKKMSKSEKNFSTLQDIVQNSSEPLAYRFFTMTGHYRTQINFTYEALRASANALRALRATVREWDKPSEGTSLAEDHWKRFLERVNDDLDMPGAVAAMWEMVKDAATPSAVKAKTLAKMDELLGLDIGKFIGEKIEIPETIKVLVEEREKARANKDWIRSDELRLEIELAGFEIEDSPEGPKLRSDH